MQVSGLHSSGETDTPTTPDTRPSVTPDDTAARDARFELRDDLRPISALERLRDCGLTVLSGGVVPVIRNGRAGFAGVVTCGSVHVCPCCSTSIRRVRQEELDQVGQFWECQSCGLVMMTLTMRHFERQPLALLVEQQVGAWRIGFGQNAGRAWRQAKVTFGVRGFVRAWEVTHGANGWHAHYHVLLFLARPLSTGRVEELQHLAFEVWADALVKVGAYMPLETGADGKPVAVRIDAPDRGESGTLARYLMKGQDGKTKWGVAAELTRLDIKTGTGGHRTPFEIARAAVLPDANPRDIALWREFERTATGIRSLYWSNGLRKLLAEMGFELDDRTDAGVAAEEAAAGTRLAMIPAATWYRHIARHKGRALALLRAAERLGVVGVRTLVESWGLVWGADVMDAEELPDPKPGELPTAADVLRQRDRADRRDRADFWRRAFAQLDIEAEAKRFAADPEAPEFRRRAEAAKRADQRRVQVAVEEAAAVADDGRAVAREEFLRRRRIANAERADDRAAALARVRERSAASAQE
ncbi:protein rep (plasmid) [Streptomyces sp. NBC_00138]|uniref:protein rep n=1 Tax=Streptomyces sp. NBC_00138 TaxID=2903625 RepID=UPI002F91B393